MSNCYRKPELKTFVQFMTTLYNTRKTLRKFNSFNAKDPGKCSGVPLDNFRKVGVQLKGKSKAAVYYVKEDFEGYEVHPVK